MQWTVGTGRHGRQAGRLQRCKGWAGIIAVLWVGAVMATPRPWMDKTQPPEVRARELLAAMTLEEKLALLHSDFAMPGEHPIPVGAQVSAAYVAPNPRLGIPALQISDAGLGIANQGQARAGDTATALPSGLALAASFDPKLAYRAGAMIGAEAFHRGFNILLAGGVNLQRDPRNGRNFEYAGEDPLLAGRIAGAEVAGVQSQHVLATVKHYALNSVESGRHYTSMDLAPQAMHESDLLAFQIAIEEGRPGSVMCAYNRVNGIYACENAELLQEILKQDWHYPGFVMSDWGAVHSAAQAVNAGLDQESAPSLDEQFWFGAPLQDALAQGKVLKRRIDDMAQRILYSLFAQGLFDYPPVRSAAPEAIDAHEEVAKQAELAGAVLLRNKKAFLPLSPQLKRVAVIGGHADVGVLSGGGSSTVWPHGGNAVPWPHFQPFPGLPVYAPSAPLKALAQRMPQTKFEYASGRDLAQAVALAKSAEVVIVFATRWMRESQDAADLKLTGRQDALIEAVARANPRTVVVLETGNPVAMPWLDRTAAVLAAWYPGSAGGAAIADLLLGRVNPSGRLPFSWPHSLQELPRPVLQGVGLPEEQDQGRTVRRSADKNDLSIEGADVGYRWYARKGLEPLFPFGYGLSYTRFERRGFSLQMRAGQLHAQVQLRNVGARTGGDVVQVYVRAPDGSPLRLAGFGKLKLAPGQSGRLDIRCDPRLLARYDVAHRQWVIAKGRYRFYAADSADLHGASELAVDLPRRAFR